MKRETEYYFECPPKKELICLKQQTKVLMLLAILEYRVTFRKRSGSYPKCSEASGLSSEDTEVCKTQNKRLNCDMQNDR
jgi:hypothetical protein